MEKGILCHKPDLQDDLFMLRIIYNMQQFVYNTSTGCLSGEGSTCEETKYRETGRDYSGSLLTAGTGQSIYFGCGIVTRDHPAFFHEALLNAGMNKSEFFGVSGM